MTSIALHRDAYGDRSWWLTTATGDQYRALGPDDTSRPASTLSHYPYGGDYNSECASCWLGHGHTLAMHVANLTKALESARLWRDAIMASDTPNQGLSRQAQAQIANCAHGLKWAERTAGITDGAERAQVIVSIADGPWIDAATAALARIVADHCGMAAR
jgi:hypothetical protein